MTFKSWNITTSGVIQILLPRVVSLMLTTSSNVMDDFNAENGTHLVSVGAIHYEPFGIYAGKTKVLQT